MKRTRTKVDPWAELAKEFERETPWHDFQPQYLEDADVSLWSALDEWVASLGTDDGDLNFQGKAPGGGVWLVLVWRVGASDLAFHLGTEYRLEEGDFPLHNDVIDSPQFPALMTLDYVQYHPKLQGGGRGSRLLQYLERHACAGHPRVTELMMAANHVHRPLFYLLANRHGWNIIRLERDSEDAPVEVTHGDDTDRRPISQYDFSPLIGLYPPPSHAWVVHHAFWTVPSARIHDLLVRNPDEPLRGRIQFVDALRIVQMQVARASDGTRFQSPDGVLDIRLVQTTDPPIVRHLSLLEGHAQPLTMIIRPWGGSMDMDAIPWYIALLVQLGRIYWRPVVVQGISDYLLNAAWDTRPPLWASRHLGERPAWSRLPDADDDDGGEMGVGLVTYQWVPLKRARFQAADDEFSDRVSEPQEAYLAATSTTGESAKKRPRLRGQCLHCGSIQAWADLATTGFALFCRATACYRDYYTDE